MYSSESISDSDIHEYQFVENGSINELPSNGHGNDSNSKEKSKGTVAKSQSNGTSGTTLSTSKPDLKSLYSRVLSNDNIVIVEKSPSPQRPQKPDVYRKGGGQNDRASRTIRDLADEELPDPDVVRKAKDVFETLARKQRQEATLKRHQSSAQDLSRPHQPSSSIGRSQSMLVLTGRAWCNGAPSLSTMGHGHIACGSCVSGSRAAMVLKNNEYNSVQSFRKAPPFQRSCSELDKFFQEDDDDDLWERHARNDRGSPVSPEVIQKIRDKGTCVQFFGSDAYVVENSDDDVNEDAFLEEKAGYLLEYPYELYPNDDSVSSKPKIIGTLPKTSSGSCASSVSSVYGGRETPSPAPPSPFNSYNGWFIGGCGVSLDDIRASLKKEDSESSSRPSSSLGSGYVKLRQLSGHRVSAAFERSHGKWMKNPYWQGSYYVIYDFTQKVVESPYQINGD